MNKLAKIGYFYNNATTPTRWKQYMEFDNYISQARKQKQSPNETFSISKRWAQGRTIYGGLSAAMLHAAGKEYVDATRLLRSMSTNFVGPLLVDEPFKISVEVIRSGKNVSQVQVRAIQNDKICVLSQLCFGLGRTSKIYVDNNDKHDMDLPVKAKFIPNIPKVTPKFLKHFEIAVKQGGLPFLGNKSSEYCGWMRFKNAPADITDAHVVGIIDVWPPTILQMLKWPAPASTVSWNLEFIYPHRPIKPTNWFAYKSHTRQAAEGYAHTEATIWDAEGEVIALSRQTVAVFD